MNTVIIPFRVRQAKLLKAKQAIRRFVSQVGKREPGTLVYESLQDCNDPTRFVHYMVFKDPKAHEHHRTSKHLQKFVDALAPLCLEPLEPQFVTRLTGIKETARKK